MKHIVIGAGQVGSALVHALSERGAEVVVIRRSDAPMPGMRTVVADALDEETLAREFEGAAAVHHCIHAPYDHRAWRRELPHRERAVMDVAAAMGVPVIFPESVYAFGRAAADLEEGNPIAPCTPLGDVRAELLEARSRHDARTASIVASDFFGPTANDGSVATLTMLRPLARGRRAWVPADLDAPHSWSYLPDLAAAMIHAGTHFDTLPSSWTATGDPIFHAPTTEPRSCRRVAQDVGASLHRKTHISSVPEWVLAVGSRVDPTVRELHAQRYLWRTQARLRPGQLTTTEGLQPTPWPTALQESLNAPGRTNTTGAA
ncbi:NAD-dependent epimerase/dehydratase family protein [Kocuria sp. KD4]|uniref:NAD-dependent epimerase/dehydratase family protein n=1 Tax=Kocuria sp. KD4 TaxID=2719588 RepID=UPI00142784C2|nr:NAD-dependent epimerase/dehydratase family protein [Kocuria sp. KD4]QIR70328.1 NAD-dependent epimerase/dehydratase family protein [Kocuria sp. KD4]